MSKIARIIRASNHFDCLQLPKPYADRPDGRARVGRDGGAASM